MPKQVNRRTNPLSFSDSLTNDVGVSPVNKLDRYDPSDKALIANLLAMGLESDDYTSSSLIEMIVEFRKDGLIWFRTGNPSTKWVDFELTWAGIRVAVQFAYELEYTYPEQPLFDRPIKEVARLYEARLWRIRK